MSLFLQQVPTARGSVAATIGASLTGDMSSPSLSPARDNLYRSLECDLKLLRSAALKAEQAAGTLVERFGPGNWKDGLLQAKVARSSNTGPVINYPGYIPTSAVSTVGPIHHPVVEQTHHAGLQTVSMGNGMHRDFNNFDHARSGHGHPGGFGAAAESNFSLVVGEIFRNISSSQSVPKWTTWKPTMETESSRSQRNQRNSGRTNKSDNNATHKGPESFGKDKSEAQPQRQHGYTDSSALLQAPNRSPREAARRNKYISSRPIPPAQGLSNIQANETNSVGQFGHLARSGRLSANAPYSAIESIVLQWVEEGCRDFPIALVAETLFTFRKAKEVAVTIKDLNDRYIHLLRSSHAVFKQKADDLREHRARVTKPISLHEPHGQDSHSHVNTSVEHQLALAGTAQSKLPPTTSNTLSRPKRSATHSRRSDSTTSKFEDPGTLRTNIIDSSYYGDPRAKTKVRSGYPQKSILMHHIPAASVTPFGLLLSQRELGSGRRNGSAINAHSVAFQLRSHVVERLTSWTSWTGVSKDVLVVSWSPDGSRYAVGGSTDMDALNIQYNRCNNLLLGDLNNQTLTELPDHHVLRPKPEEIEVGDNSRQAVYDSVDPQLYTTVSSLCFEQTGRWMFTASYDKTVKLWDITTSNAVCIQTLKHSANVDHVTLNGSFSVFATGQRDIENPVQIFSLDSVKDEERAYPAVLHSSFSSQRPGKVKLHPSSLRWGIHSAVDHLLLAGFSQDGEDERHLDGDLCLWDVTRERSIKLSPSAQSVFDTCWHPSLPLFAAATSLGRGHIYLTHRSTKSVIRTWQPLETSSRVMEYECPAYDINVLTFNPRADNYITAGCTDGVTYVWDCRMPNEILHRLAHGRPIDEQDPNRSRQDQDTGVCFSAWDKDGQRLYTGSSDGKIKAWNIYGSSEDALIRDIATFDAGILCGEFSPAYDKLLLGLSKGSIQILSATDLALQGVGDDDGLGSDRFDSLSGKITHVPAKRFAVSEQNYSGVELSRELLNSGKLVMHPIYGAGKGPDYDGPYAAYARPEGSNPRTTELLPDIRVTQLDKTQRLQALEEGGRASKADKEKYQNEMRLARARNYERYGISKEASIEKRHCEEHSNMTKIAGHYNVLFPKGMSHETLGPSKRPRVEKTPIFKGEGTVDNPMVLDDDDDEDEKNHSVKAAALLAKFTRPASQLTTHTTQLSSQRSAMDNEPPKTRQSTRLSTHNPSPLPSDQNSPRKPPASKPTKAKSPVTGHRRSGLNSRRGQVAAEQEGEEASQPAIKEEEVEGDEEEPGSPLNEVDWF
ncbi:MAG: hypothetical protein MMC33_005453 [Icmadophila ericetorum]|nr:hypothetical protein [Icmadophila ericetorum]